MLTRNYRSHPALVSLPSRLFYGGALVAAANPGAVSGFCGWAGLAPGARAAAERGGLGFPMLFHGVEGEDEREGNSPSWFNQVELMVRSVSTHCDDPSPCLAFRCSRRSLLPSALRRSNDSAPGLPPSARAELLPPLLSKFIRRLCWSTSSPPWRTAPPPGRRWRRGTSGW